MNHSVKYSATLNTMLIKIIIHKIQSYEKFDKIV